MKKIMLIGKTGTGKTSLTQRLTQQPMAYKKTQSLEFCDFIVDTPGEYIENRAYYKALIVSSCEVEIVALLQDATLEESLFPPGFATAFNKKVIGIITKVDLVNQVEKAEDALLMAGATEIFKISNVTEQGIKELMTYLQNK